MTLKVDPRLVPLAKPTTSSDEVKAKNTIVAGTDLLSPKQADAFERTVGAQNLLTGKSATPSHVASRTSAVSKDYVVVSSNDDDPFARPNNLEHMSKADFTLDAKGKPIGLEGPRVKIEEEGVIYKTDSKTGQYVEFANNPWTATHPNSAGNFSYPKEPRFPTHGVVRDSSGAAVLDAQGKQQWNPRDLQIGKTTTFESVNHVSHAMEGWAGRPISWGENGQMVVNTHAFVGFNAFFSPAARGLFFGVVPYRLPGETEIKMFEMASSWEVAAHEAGHALHNDLKPNRGLVDEGYRQWGESFGDQLAMWSSLQDPDRAKAIVKETRGDMNKSNAVSAIGEVYAGLVGEGTGLRDAFQNKTVSTTTDEFHDRSEVLTGASYKIFVQVYKDQLKQGLSPEAAVSKSAEIMGTFLARTTDFTPENTMTLEDVAKAYLKVDKELFGGRYQSTLVKEFEFREIFHKAAPATDGTPAQSSSFEDWQKHEASLPVISLDDKRSDESVNALVQANLAKLGIPPEFGATLQSNQVNANGEHIVRIELTRGQGKDAEAIGNHGLLVFRKDGSLADYQPIFPAGLEAGDALKLLDMAKEAGLEEQGKVGFVRGEDGLWTVQVVKPKEDAVKGSAIGATYQVYDLEHPEGREVDLEGHNHDELVERYGKYLPNGAQILTADEL